MKKSHILSIIKKLISKKAMAYLFLSFGVGHAEAQLGSVGIGTANPHSSAILDITASDKGLMLPVVSLASAADKITVPNPKVGFVIYNKSIAGTGNDAVKKGLYVFNGTAWELMWTKAESKAEVPKIPFIKPVFAASNTVVSSNLTAGSTNTLTFNTLYRDSPTGVQGAVGDYTGYAIQQDGRYKISYMVGIEATTTTGGDIVFTILKNGIVINTFANRRQDSFGGALGSYSTDLMTGDVISFQIKAEGSVYKLMNQNVSISKISNQ